MKTVKIKTAREFLVVLIAAMLVCVGLSPKAQAVNPPPDGGYPGGNTAKGHNAFLTLTTGSYNTALGFFSLASNMTGSFNTATGAGARFLSTLPITIPPPELGGPLSNSTGDRNTANGTFILFNNTTGDSNTAQG
jgi:hypothetical protein